MSGFSKKFKAILFHGTTKTVFELIDSTCSIHELCNSRKEWVRFVRDIQFYKRIFISIFPFYGFFGWCTRGAQKCVLVGHIFKHNQAVIFWVNIFLHNAKIGVQR